ncbi:MAG: hypothetical protein ACREQZ_05440 [Woeseiaceae bacterium]
MTRTFVFLSALTAALLITGCTTARPVQSAPLVGAWRSSLQFETGAFAAIKDLEFMYVFNAGGTLTESSNYDGAPPVPPAYGVWRAVGPNEFEAKYEYFSTAPSDPDAIMKGAGWLPSGRGVFTERIKLADDAQTFTSTIRYDALGLRGEPTEGGGEAKGRAVRIPF